MATFQLKHPENRELLGGDLLAQCLHALGAKVAFGIHGGHLDAFLMGCADVGIDLVDVRHETVAIQAAEGYAKVSGRVGVGFITANSGFCNGLPGLATAFADRSPVFVVTSSPPLRDAETNCLQGFHDQVVLAKNVTKFAHRITNVGEIPRLVSLGWRTTTAGAPGPVVLDFPIDVLFTPIANENIAWGSLTSPPNALPGPDPAAIDDAIEMWRAAARPAIIASTGARGAVNELLKLAEATGTPIFHSTKFSTAIPYEHPFRAGGARRLAALRVNRSLPPDFILLLGARTGLMLGGRSGAIIPHEGCKTVHVDLDGSEIGRSLPVDLGIVSDVGLAVAAMNAAVAKNPFRSTEEWIRSALGLKSIRAPHNEDESVIVEDNGRLHPYHAMKKVYQCIPNDSTVIIDGGECGGWAMQLLEEAHAGLAIASTGYLGFLGNGWGYSLGAAIADPSKLVLSIQGDGSAGFHIAELDTYVKFGLKIVTIIMNNSVWGMSQAGQDIIYGYATAKRPTVALNPKAKYEVVAEGFGCTSAVKTLEALDHAMDKLVHAQGPGLLNLVVSDHPYQDTTKAMVGQTDDPNVIVVPYYDNIPKPYYKDSKQAVNGANGAKGG
ncbi:acetolactate synthase I/II/III large subunit [Rhizodiscina lignyota]|uniref:Acetolactate synthase I/II/III large subunit n=1 Tax=Rhizodiscina lignyota TaxID=1504668 RepID=A0A9P4IJZ4_9PEZI|nr:acetolactate synthase I/II/III large subunit [Rhizodiscina lignyota]